MAFYIFGGGTQLFYKLEGLIFSFILLSLKVSSPCTYSTFVLFNQHWPFIFRVYNNMSAILFYFTMVVLSFLLICRKMQTRYIPKMLEFHLYPAHPLLA